MLDGLIEIARIADIPWRWTGTGFRVFCIELRSPTEYLHVAVLGDTDIRAVATKDYIDSRLLDAWAHTMSEMAAGTSASNLATLTTRWD